jgi:hypothetical protein
VRAASAPLGMGLVASTGTITLFNGAHQTVGAPLKRSHHLKPTPIHASASLQSLDEDSEGAPAKPSNAAPKASSRKVSDLPASAQALWKKTLAPLRVWAGEQEDPWSIDDAELQMVIAALWTNFIGDWDLVSNVQQQVAVNIVRFSCGIHSIFADSALG